MQSLEKPKNRLEKEFEKQGITLISIRFIDEETYIYITEKINTLPIIK